jgi:hypothetical protein
MTERCWHRDDCATLPRVEAVSMSLGFSQRWLQQSGGPQSSLTSNEAMQSTCHDRFEGKRLKFTAHPRVCGRSPRIYARHRLAAARVRWLFLSIAAQLLCGAQQLSDCKFWVRMTTGGIVRSLS